MNIAYIAGWPIPSRAANAVHVMKMCQAFSKHHTVKLYCPDGAGQDIEGIQNLHQHYGVTESFDVFPIEKKEGRLGLIKYAFQAVKKAKKNGAEIVYSRCLMSAWMATLFGMQTVFEKHSSLDGQGGVAKAVFKSLIRSRHFNSLVVISDALKEHLAERFSIPYDRIISAHDGADEFPSDQQPAPFVTGQGKFHAGYIGHLYQGRGIDIIAEMAKELDNVQFHIVGGKKEDIDFWKGALSDLKNIHFYGYVPHHETIAFLQHSDVLLAPYQRKVGGYNESDNTVQWMSPLKIFEYMSTGIPMICSDLPVLHEILRDQENCFLCVPDDSKDWVEALRTIMGNPEKSSDVARQAKKEFLGKYTWQKRADYIAAEIEKK